jgi:hypothetical protein
LSTEHASHVSLVAGYEGTGDDAHMDAFLLQCEGQTAVLGVWRHDGTGWRQESAVGVGNLPIAGEMRIETSPGSASIFVNEKRVLSNIAMKVGLDDSTRLGIRCLGASVRPCP